MASLKSSSKKNISVPKATIGWISTPMQAKQRPQMPTLKPSTPNKSVTPIKTINQRGQTPKQAKSGKRGK